MSHKDVANGLADFEQVSVSIASSDKRNPDGHGVGTLEARKVDNWNMESL